MFYYLKDSMAFESYEQYHILGFLHTITHWIWVEVNHGCIDAYVVRELHVFVTKHKANTFYLTIRLRAWDFYEVIVDEAKPESTIIS